MARVLSVLAWFHVSLAMVLATVALLAVPQSAFAESGCPLNCKNWYGLGNSDYWNCIAGCCDQEDPENREQCCSNYCNPSDTDCPNECYLVPPTPCQTLVIGGTASGCVNPGAQCMFGDKQSSCTVTITNHCTCAAI